MDGLTVPIKRQELLPKVKKKAHPFIRQYLKHRHMLERLRVKQWREAYPAVPTLRLSDTVEVKARSISRVHDGHVGEVAESTQQEDVKQG